MFGPLPHARVILTSHVFKYRSLHQSDAAWRRRKEERELFPCRPAAVQGYTWKISHHPPLSDTLGSDKCKLWHLGKQGEWSAATVVLLMPDPSLLNGPPQA